MQFKWFYAKIVPKTTTTLRTTTTPSASHPDGFASEGDLVVGRMTIKTTCISERVNILCPAMQA
ncbi:MAG: hypothetical protein LBB23_01005 [Rickettsiales bacterium]|nr:hypothetical protein [Rickettsiales bacterium]